MNQEQKNILVCGLYLLMCEQFVLINSIIIINCHGRKDGGLVFYTRCGKNWVIKLGLQTVALFDGTFLI